MEKKKRANEYHLHTASSEIEYGEWCTEKPDWNLEGLKGFKTRIVAVKKDKTGNETWWEVWIIIPDIKTLKKLYQKFGKLIFVEEEIQIYDDYVE